MINDINALEKEFKKGYITIKVFMSRVLKLKDFQWIVINKEKTAGYYSYKKKDWEIAIDWDSSRSWTIYLCNKFEEVLEEYGCVSLKEAIKIANKINKSFTN